MLAIYQPTHFDPLLFSASTNFVCWDISMVIGASSLLRAEHGKYEYAIPITALSRGELTTVLSFA